MVGALPCCIGGGGLPDGVGRLPVTFKLPVRPSSKPLPVDLAECTDIPDPFTARICRFAMKCLPDNITRMKMRIYRGRMVLKNYSGSLENVL